MKSAMSRGTENLMPFAERWNVSLPCSALATLVGWNGRLAAGTSICSSLSKTPLSDTATVEVSTGSPGAHAELELNWRSGSQLLANTTAPFGPSIRLVSTNSAASPAEPTTPAPSARH